MIEKVRLRVGGRKMVLVWQEMGSGGRRKARGEKGLRELIWATKVLGPSLTVTALKEKKSQKKSDPSENKKRGKKKKTLPLGGGIRRKGFWKNAVMAQPFIPET